MREVDQMVGSKYAKIVPVGTGECHHLILRNETKMMSVTKFVCLARFKNYQRWDDCKAKKPISNTFGIAFLGF